MENSAIATSPGNFVDQPPIEHSADALSVSGPDNNVIRLPGYSKHALSLKLAEEGPFEVKARSLFPILARQPGMSRHSPRFAIKIIKSGQPVYQRRYSADETSLAVALANALRWIRIPRREEKWTSVCSWPLLTL